jgi:nuclear pore complex protein Nup188
LRTFLDDEANQATLASPWKPFPPPSSEEKSRFESTTAPICVTPAQTNTYNIDEIKEDSLWLSKEANISQYAALLLVLQEWHTRPVVQLLSGLTQEEALSVQEAAGFSNLGASTFVPNSSILGNPSTLGLQSDAQFDSSDQRKLRIMEIYHSTCVSILRISQLLIAWGCAGDLRKTPFYSRDYTIGDGWLEDMGKIIANKQSVWTSDSNRESALDKSISALRAKLDTLNEGCRWNMSDSTLEAAHNKWFTSHTTELVHVLHIILLHADVITREYIPAPTMEAWFTIMAEVGFFREFPIVCLGSVYY